MRGEIYIEQMLEQMPRLLGQLNRNPASDTYGCFDREYWHYKITDFPCCRKQEAVLTLALLYNLDHKSNFYYNNGKILQWINAGLSFWVKIQEKNGSMNEWYPKENSFVGTAFNAYSISETMLLLGGKIRNYLKLKKALKKSINWLSKKKELKVQNQQSGAILAIYNFYLISQNIKYKNIVDKKINLLFKAQSEEGWFMEYGGPDIGYLSLLISYLGKYYNKSKDPIAFKMLDKAIKFIRFFVYPGFSFGGEIGSRNTEYLLPDGFEIMAEEIEDARYISLVIKDSLKKKKVISLFSQDDRYLCYNSYNYIEAFIFSKNIKYKFRDELFEKNFAKSGIYVGNTPKYYFILNYFKGSIHVLFKKNGKELFDDGFSGFMKNGKKVYSSFINNKNKFLKKDNKFIVVGMFSFIPEKNMNFINYFLLRLIQYTFGRNEKIGIFIKNVLRNILITPKSNLTGKYKRIFLFQNESFDIVDKLRIKNGFKCLYVSPKSSYVYIPSSRYFNPKEIEIKSSVCLTNTNKKILIHRKFNDEGKVIITK